MKTADTVSVLIPLKAEYVSIARLTASGIANRIGFDIDTIEDIKVALSEVLSKIIEKQLAEDRIVIDFLYLEDGITINFKLTNQNISDLFDNETDQFALAIISSLMDEVDLQKREHDMITMTKKLGRAV
ncbi:MAG: ATP-binding protein [Clostridia bacterium]|nr:ATP-binding protein [Clostridia bacterium]